MRCVGPSFRNPSAVSAGYGYGGLNVVFTVRHEQTGIISDSGSPIRLRQCVAEHVERRQPLVSCAE